MENNSAIGNKLNLARKNAGITLQELSVRTGLSVSCLSNMEHGVTSPSVKNLETVCTALEIDFIQLLSDTVSFNPIVRKDERKLIFTDSHRVQYRMITDSRQQLKGSVLTVDKDYYGEEVSYGHTCDELLIIEEGDFAVTLENKEYVLKPGDTVYIRANMPHKYRKVSNGDAVLYCVKTNMD